MGCDTKTDIILTEIPVFTPTKEVAVAIVGVGQTAIIWNNTTTVSHDAAKVLILRNNIAETEMSSGTDTP